jgi:hypothetical protein
MTSGSWTPRTEEVQGILFNGNMQEVADWILTVLPEANIDISGWTVTLLNENDAPYFGVMPGYYIYWMEEGLHTIPRENFEMMYQRVEEPS